jgi:hypothetical protein
MKNAFTAAILLLTCHLNSQNKIKYETVFFEDKTVETPVARYMLTGVLSEDEVIKAKVKITNYTDKTLVIKPEECSFSTPAGDLVSKDRWIVIAPRQQEAKTIDVKGNGIKTDATTLKLNGIYVCNNSTPVAGKDMPLPPEKELKIGNFELELDTWDRDGKEIMIKYRVTYLGDQIGQFAPGKVVLKSPEGAVFKNDKEKDRVYSFKKKEDFLCGFLFISDSKKDNTLMWQDAFSEAVPEKTEAVSIDLKMDAAKTKEKN